MPKKVSLKQFLIKTGKFDNVSECIGAIKSGMMTIDDKPVTNPNFYFNSKKSMVKMNEEKLKRSSNLYLVMNKPLGFICQKSPNEKSIYDLINVLGFKKEELKSLHSVGRLDKDTEGLVILTNDGKFGSMIADPSSNVVKRYFAVLEKPMDRQKMRLLEKGVFIELDDQQYKTKKCKIKSAGEKEAYISISEGKKRQIRKMFESIGNKVIYLKRISIGGLQLGDLKAGEIKQVDRNYIIQKIIYD